MDAAVIGSAIFIAQVALGGAAGHAFRRSWHEALDAPAAIPPNVATFPPATSAVRVGAYLPERRQAVIAPALRDQPRLASLAVQLHELGHREQHLATPFAVWLQWPLQAITILAGGLGALLILGGLLRANPGLSDLGGVLVGANAAAAFGLVLLEWDASRRGIALLASAKSDVPTGLRPLLLLAALTYLALVLTLLLPILRPEAACSLPSANDGPDSSRPVRQTPQERRRQRNGESGTGDSANQRGSARGADGRNEGSHDPGRAGSG